jgi:hypothetical protein
MWEGEHVIISGKSCTEGTNEECGKKANELHGVWREERCERRLVWGGPEMSLPLISQPFSF